MSDSEDEIMKSDKKHLTIPIFNPSSSEESSASSNSSNSFKNVSKKGKRKKNAKRNKPKKKSKIEESDDSSELTEEEKKSIESINPSNWDLDSWGDIYVHEVPGEGEDYEEPAKWPADPAIVELSRKYPHLVLHPIAIVPGVLYLGNSGTAARPDILARIGITHIINMCEMPCYWRVKENYHKFGYNDLSRPIKYLRAYVADQVGLDFEPILEKCLGFINKAKEEGGITLVHCWASQSRSVAVVLGYLISIGRRNLGIETAKISNQRHRTLGISYVLKIPTYSFMDVLLRRANMTRSEFLSEFQKHINIPMVRKKLLSDDDENERDEFDFDIFGWPSRDKRLSGAMKRLEQKWIKEIEEDEEEKKEKKEKKEKESKEDESKENNEIKEKDETKKDESKENNENKEKDESKEKGETKEKEVKETNEQN
ncbi:3712_t:CDS:2 [Ambispora leptoticha]|uniref:protein-tyrosine-phosphatase n=1 Tax=Ambispora leptoticha TaxID=144679 RepID=A0A9N9CMT6_9GLOM|nr:3712_t:CDS:2 [Ambispora leptoticha]